MTKQTTHKPLTIEQYNIVLGKNPLVDLILYTGVRISESKRLVDQWFKLKAFDEPEYLDIKVKKSKERTLRVWLNDPARESLDKLFHLVDKSIKTYERFITKTSSELNIKFTAHDLRTTFASRLNENGEGIKTIQSLLGHADISTTAMYIHTSEHMIKAALKSLEDKYTITSHGMTPAEMLEELNRRNKYIKRLESQIDSLKKEQNV